MNRVVEAPLPEFFDFIRNGMSVKQDKEGAGLPITRIETIANGTIDEGRFGYAGLTKPEASKWLLKRGDILFSHINSVDHIGKCAIFDMDRDVVHGMNLLCFRPKFDQTDPNFIKWFFRSAGFRSQIMPFVNKAVNQASISIGNLSSIKVKVPPLSEQKRIAAILDHADKLRRKRQRAIERFNQLGQAIFHEMFGSDEEYRALGSVCDVSSGSTPSRENSAYYTGEIPWVKTGEVNGTRIRTTSEHITEEAKRSSRLKLYSPGTILLAMYGQGKTRGQVGILEISATTNQACAAITCSEQAMPDFLFLQLKMNYDLIRGMGRGGNQPNLNAGIVKEIPIIVPTIERQRLFVERLRQSETIERGYAGELVAMDRLFSALQHSAFQGEL